MKTPEVRGHLQLLLKVLQHVVAHHRQELHQVVRHRQDQVMRHLHLRQEVRVQVVEEVQEAAQEAAQEAVRRQDVALVQVQAQVVEGRGKLCIS